ncbi:MAG: regulatory protein RecX [Micromonosporaceae bacterium]
MARSGRYGSRGRRATGGGRATGSGAFGEAPSRAGKDVPSAAGEDAPSGAEAERDPREQARAIALRQLAVRPRTRVELATALTRRGIPEDIVEAVLERFSEVGMIDDAAFAEAWVTSRHHGRGLARRALGHELRRKGVDGATVSDALGQLDGDTELATAQELVRRRLRTLSAAPPEVAFRRLAGMLARKGYPPGLTLRVVRDALAARSAETADLELLSDAAEAELLSGDDPLRVDAELLAADDRPRADPDG